MFLGTTLKSISATSYPILFSLFSLADLKNN